MAPRCRRSWFVRTVVIVIAFEWLSAILQADDRPLGLPDGWPDPAKIGPEVPEKTGGTEAEAKSAEKDGPLDPFFDLIDPARFQRALDRGLGAWLGLGRPEKTRPEVPEIGEPVFFDLSRPLGAKKYSNEINYLLNPSSKNAPTLQVIEYEYAFADWNSAELDLSYFNGSLEILTPFYQRTLGVGRQGRSVRGIQLSPDIYLRSGFVGGSAVYVYGWKPSEESRFSALTFAGVNRVLIGGFQFPNAGVSRFGPMTPMIPATRNRPDDSVYGSWRPTFNLDLFYKLSKTVSLGIENDLFFQSGRGGEYFSFPFLTWEAGQHAFFQLGGGYYHFESRDQFTFLLHLNFVNPSVRESTKAEAGGDASKPADRGADRDEVVPSRIGSIRSKMRRLWSNR